MADDTVQEEGGGAEAPPVGVEDTKPSPSMAQKEDEVVKGRDSEPGSGQDQGDSGALGRRSVDQELIQRYETIEDIQHDAEEECTINSRTLAHILSHIKCGQRALDSLTELVSALLAAQDTYATAHMRACESLSPWGMRGPAPLTSGPSAADEDVPPGPADGPLAGALACTAAAHRQLRDSLAAVAADLRQLLVKYRQIIGEVETESTALLRGFEVCKRSLASAVKAHTSSRKALDAVFVERNKGGLVRSPEVDPWTTEASLVAAATALTRWQDRHREFLRGSFRAASAIEGDRAAAARDALRCLATAYSTAGQAVAADMLPLQEVVAHSSPPEEDADLAALRRVMAGSVGAIEGLAARQALAVRMRSQDLFCSGEVVRQGALEHWHAPTCEWRNCHIVLTRAGFLHVLADADFAQGLDILPLSRCHVQSGSPPVFSLQRVPGRLAPQRLLPGKGERTFTFRTASDEEACEWTILMRDAIRVAAGKNSGE